MGYKVSRLAGIQYAGLPGITSDCRDSIVCLLQCRKEITQAKILSCLKRHCFLLTSAGLDLIAIKSGFGSGYHGEGATAFSFVLQLLEAHFDFKSKNAREDALPIEEYEITKEVMERLDNSALTTSDLKKINSSKPVRPIRWRDYIFEKDWEGRKSGTLWSRLDPIIPYSIIDSRIVDLALSFWDGPDNKLFTGWRRLEVLVKKRTGINESGAKLFSQAFQGEESKLVWNDIDKSEQDGRGSMFSAAYKAYRNPRAHRELHGGADEQLLELLALNQLFSLENGAENRD